MSDEGTRRLLDAGSDAPAELRRLLALAEADLPSTAQLGSLASKLPLPAGPPGGPDGSPDGGGAGPDAGSGGGGDVGGGDIGGGAGTGAAVGAGLAKALAPLAVKVGVALVAGAAVVGGGTALWLRAGAGDDPGPPAVAPAPPDPPPSAPSAPPPPAARPEPRPAATPDGSAPEPRAPSRPPEPEAPPDPAAELRLLEEAQDALASSPARSLDLLRRHEREFPSSALAQEREVLAIEALVRAGRRAAASRRAERFESRWPGSSHNERIRRLVGHDGDEETP